MDKETKDRILGLLYELEPEKRHKIMQLATYLSEDDTDDMRYDVMIAYLDKGMDKKLDKDFKAMMNSGFSYSYPEEGESSSIPRKVIVQKKKKK